MAKRGAKFMMRKKKLWFSMVHTMAMICYSGSFVSIGKMNFFLFLYRTESRKKVMNFDTSLNSVYERIMDIVFSVTVFNFALTFFVPSYLQCECTDMLYGAYLTLFLPCTALYSFVVLLFSSRCYCIMFWCARQIQP